MGNAHPPSREVFGAGQCPLLGIPTLRRGHRDNTNPDLVGMKGEKCLGVFALESKATKLAVWQHTIVINPTREKEQRPDVKSG